MKAPVHSMCHSVHTLWNLVHAECGPHDTCTLLLLLAAGGHCSTSDHQVVQDREDSQTQHVHCH